MKKFLFVLSAIALLGLTSCVEQMENNPNYNPETNAVLTNVVFNVSTSNTPTTKQTSADTQASTSETFRGLTDAVLLSFKLGVSNNGDYVTAATTTADKAYHLGDLIAADGLHPSSTTVNDPISHRIIELALPLETNELMFWGKAPMTTTANAQGSIDFKIPSTSDKDLSTFEFSLKQRIPGDGDEQTRFLQYQAALAYTLNYIMESSFSGDIAYPAGSTAQTFNVKWSDYVTIEANSITVKTTSPVDANTAISPLGEVLGDAYKAINTVNPNEVRAGSAEAIRRMMQDLYQVVKKVADATPTTMPEAVAANVAQQIESRIGNAFQDPGTDCAWKTVANWASGTGYTGGTSLMTTPFTNFPKAPFGVPMGSCELQVAYTTGANQKVTWSYLQNLNASGFGGGTANLFNYMYPAELCYFGNSPIRVSADPHVANDYPDGVANWDNDASWLAGATGTNSSAWEKSSHVHSTTRSVAMQENINYGTALLKSTVTYGNSVLKDNNHAIQKLSIPNLPDTDELDKEITVSGTSFTLVGVLIGGQAQTMGWNYIKKSGNFDKMIYDSNLPSTAIPATVGTESTPNYTLVWDNYDENNAGSTTKQSDVYIALEFVNGTGEDFWGNANMVRKGGTFYLIGKLDPDAIAVSGKTTAEIAADQSLGITWPDHYALPPLDANGNTIKERRVFIQDYMTTAKFVIGENSLKSAYVTVPDLRSTQISLGLSVDCTWQTGLVFNNIILGQ